MNNDFMDIQEEQHTEVQFADVNFTDAGDRKRRKRRRRSTVFTVMGLSGFVVLLLLVAYLCLQLWQQEQANEAEQVLAEIEQALYTQQEMDAAVQEAVVAQSILAADTRQAEILDGIRHSLESGVSTVEMLRNYYPEYVVLASGGTYHFAPISDTLPQNEYDGTCLNILETGEYQYMDGEQVVSYKGIDVSKHQGKINWKKVAEDGVEFAFIRVALRGYGTGKLVEDERFEQNIKDALAAGIKVGVYVYSQAITEEEVLEEANFVLEKIAPYKIECPVVFDVELVAGADGRMNALSVEERTKLTALFCETIKNAGYKPMIYHNMEMGILKINLEELQEYDKWFAYYNPNFYYPYEYDVWQYSEKGRVNGINGDVDLNISFVPLWEE